MSDTETVRQCLERHCLERGMWGPQAQAVVQATVDASAKTNGGDPMAGRWDDRADSYPPAMFAVLCLSVKKAAIAYIDANCPKAWFRPLFL